MVALFDTHAHLIGADESRYPRNLLRGQTELQPLPPAFTGEQLLAEMAANDVRTACLVQRAHVYGYDNSYVIDCAANNPERLISVGVFDALEARTPALIEDLARNRGLGGVRFCAVRPWEMDTGWFNSLQAMKSWEAAAKLGLPVSIIFFHYQLSYVLPALRLVAQNFPELPIIIDHIGCGHATVPEIAWGREQGWDVSVPGPPDYGLVGALTPFVEQRNCSFKFSQINVHRLRDAGIPLSTFVRRFTDLFGPDRLIWGSDIGQSPGAYPEMASAGREAAGELDESERRLFLHDNAARIYGRIG